MGRQCRKDIENGWGSSQVRSHRGAAYRSGTDARHGASCHCGDSRTDDTAEAVEAEQDGLGSAVSNLNGEEGILVERRVLSCAEAWSGVLFGAVATDIVIRQSHPRPLTERRNIEKPENQSLWGIPLPGSAVAE